MTVGVVWSEEVVSPSSATLSCDTLEYRSSDGIARARGNVVLVSSGTRVLADELDLKVDARSGRARGRVSVDDGALTILADEMTFDAGTSSGVFVNGYFEDPPYRMWARKIVRASSSSYHLEHAAMTSCDEDPPHYHVRMASMDFFPRRRAVARWPRLVLEQDTLLGFPYYRKTFGDKPWTLTVDPGHSSYNGVYTKSIFSYKLTPSGTARLYWDHFQYTGEGLGSEYTYHGPRARGSVYGYRTEDRLAKTKRWNLRAAHWQALSPRLTLELNALAQSDSNFNNFYFRDDLYRVRTEARSDAALTYRRDAFTVRTSASHVRTFDPVRGSFVGTATTLPGVNFQGAPWTVARNTYLTLALSGQRRYDRPSISPPALDPIVDEKDRYRWTGDGSASLRRRILINRRMTLEPSAGMRGRWESWRDAGAAMDPHDLIQGQGFTGLNFRHRLTRSIDYDLGHTYQVRWSPNQFKRDHSAWDQGTETNQLTWSGNARGRTGSLRLASGYDLRDPKGEPVLSPRQKVVPPSLDLYWYPVRWTRVSFREVYGLYPVRRPQSAQLSWSLTPARDFQFSSGFSYNGGLPGQLQMRHGASFQLTRGWAVEGNVRYVMEGAEGFRYRSVPKDRFEQEFILRRDLHCWKARITFRKRPGFTEAYVRLDLKSGGETRRQLRSPEEEQYYPGRELD